MILASSSKKINNLLGLSLPIYLFLVPLHAILHF